MLDVFKAQLEANVMEARDFMLTFARQSNHLTQTLGTSHLSERLHTYEARQRELVNQLNQLITTVDKKLATLEPSSPQGENGLLRFERKTNEVLEELEQVEPSLAPKLLQLEQELEAVHQSLTTLKLGNSLSKDKLESTHQSILKLNGQLERLNAFIDK